jgi:hypothetical protein
MDTDKHGFFRCELREFARIKFAIIREIRVKVFYPCPSVLLSVKTLFFCANFLPALPGDVAQICNLLYRRIVFGWVPCATGSSGLAMAGGWQIRDTAEYHSALLRLRLRRAVSIRG